MAIVGKKMPKSYLDGHEWDACPSCHECRGCPYCHCKKKAVPTFGGIAFSHTTDLGNEGNISYDVASTSQEATKGGVSMVKDKEVEGLKLEIAIQNQTIKDLHLRLNDGGLKDEIHELIAVRDLAWKDIDNLKAKLSGARAGSQDTVDMLSQEIVELRAYIGLKPGQGLRQRKDREAFQEWMKKPKTPTKEGQTMFRKVAKWSAIGALVVFGAPFVLTKGFDAWSGAVTEVTAQPTAIEAREALVELKFALVGKWMEAEAELAQIDADEQAKAEKAAQIAAIMEKINTIDEGLLAYDK